VYRVLSEWRGTIRWFCLAASGLVCVASAAAEIPYLGTSLHDSTQIRGLCATINAVDAPAEARAELATGLPMDRDRLDLALVDVPVGLTRFHVSMSAGGYDSVTVRVYAHFWLRSVAADSLLALRTLTHEYIHAILRQHMHRDDYSRLPEWFQEGVATYLSGEHGDRLWVALAHHWRDPQALHVGLADGPAIAERVAGSWWFAALDHRYGPESTKRCLGALVAGHNLVDALAPFGCSIDDLWRVAEGIAASEVQSLTGKCAAQLRECMETGSLDSEQRRKRIGELIKKHRGTYAAEFALYFAAKLSYDLLYLQDARRYLDELASCPRDYGYGDAALYLRLRIAAECHRDAEARRYCREYFSLWPDGSYWGMVTTICRKLP
jgi:hypothetical protein